MMLLGSLVSAVVAERGLQIMRFFNPCILHELMIIDFLKHRNKRRSVDTMVSSFGGAALLGEHIFLLGGFILGDPIWY